MKKRMIEHDESKNNFLPHLFQNEILFKLKENEVAAEVALTPEPKISLKKIGISHDQDELNNSDKDFLKKVIQSIGFDYKKDVLFLKKGIEINENNSNDISAENLLIFSKKNTTESRYKILPTKSLRIIYCHSLDEVQNSIAYKKELWQSLKKLFSKE